jgi:hypothetical protein
VKVRQIKALIFRHRIEDDKLVKSDAPANRLIPAAAPDLSSKALDDFEQLPAFLIDIR